MKKVLYTALAAATLVALPSLSHANPTPYSEMPAGVYELDEAHASLIWKVSHLGLSNYTARFTSFDAELTFDPESPENSSLVATIDPTSLETDYPYPEQKDFDEKLVKSEDWFNAPAFPKITFTSTGLTKTSETTGEMTGDLTFLGVTKPVTLDVTFNGAMAEQPFSKKPTLGFSARGVIKRSEWGMATYVPNIGDEVEIVIEAEFAQETAKAEEKSAE